MPDVIVPYQGGHVTISEEAQVAARAAQDFAQADPNFANALKTGGANKLDQASAIALKAMEQQMRSTPPKPATIINLHPWALSIPTNRFTRGINVPACEPGMPYAYQHIRGYRRDWEYNEDGSLKFTPILPISLAAEFVREFSNRDTYGGGVIIYEGDGHPEKREDVETYDPIGRLITMDQPGVEYDEENRPVPALIKIPVKRKLVTMIQEQREARNRLYLQRVQKADRDYKLPDGKGKWLLTEVHLLMAEMLFAEHVIPAVPEWNLASRLEAGMAENSCPGCGSDPRAGAFKCSSCGHILNAFAAYKAGAIEYGHVSMDTMTSDEWEEAEELKATREKSREDALQRRKTGKADVLKPAKLAKAKAEKPEDE